jgi:surface antigen
MLCSRLFLHATAAHARLLVSQNATESPLKMRMLNVLLSVVLFALGTGTALASNVTFMRNSPLAKMTAEDLDLMRTTLRETLDRAADDAPKRWENPKTGASGVVTPLKSYQRDGMACRVVEIFNEAQGFSGRTRHDFCKQPDGTWKAPAPASSKR